MIQSMTGFGQEVIFLEEKKITIDIKTLNSKQCDINIRIPGFYREREIQMRSLIANQLERGKIELNIHVEKLSDTENFKINKDQFSNYYSDLQSITKDLDLFEKTNFSEIIMRMPEILQPVANEIEDEEWNTLFTGIEQCLKRVQEYRKSEGEILAATFLTNISKIEQELKNIHALAPSRVESIKERIKQAFNDFKEENRDENRFGQEMIYYLEKLDITEEEVRLASHCNFFRKELNSNSSKGKKLGFISQEIGREINTIGSKANHTEIQHLVVEMKDELEKIKEQMLNIL